LHCLDFNKRAEQVRNDLHNFGTWLDCSLNLIWSTRRNEAKCQKRDRAFSKEIGREIEGRLKAGRQAVCDW